MKTLLVINASSRTDRSITRHLTNRYVSAWKLRFQDGHVVSRDLGVNPPPAISEAWIAAAFTNSAERTSEMVEALAMSEALIDEIVRADAIALGTPMYNFGMPAQLKAYVDQIVRVGRTFVYDPSSADGPYRPLLAAKPVTIVMSCGDGSFHRGGAMEHLNFLEPHLEAVFPFLGLSDLSFVRVGYDEYKDDRFKQSLAAAELAVDRLVDRLP